MHLFAETKTEISKSLSESSVKCADTGGSQRTKLSTKIEKQRGNN